MNGRPLGFFEIANYFEAALWAGMALWSARRAMRTQNWRMWALAIALFLFGGSDLVEVQTGAWYRPWWLLAWKGACLAAIAVVLVQHRRSDE